MRVNIYAEEMTERVEIIAKEIEGTTFTGLRLYLELPCTVAGPMRGDGKPSEPVNVSGPFMHRPGDDDSAAITFWGKRDLRKVLRIMLAKLDEHYAAEVGAAARKPPEATDKPIVKALRIIPAAVRILAEEERFWHPLRPTTHIDRHGNVDWARLVAHANAADSAASAATPSEGAPPVEPRAAYIPALCSRCGHDRRLHEAREGELACPLQRHARFRPAPPGLSLAKARLGPTVYYGSTQADASCFYCGLPREAHIGDEMNCTTEAIAAANETKLARMKPPESRGGIGGLPPGSPVDGR